MKKKLLYFALLLLPLKNFGVNVAAMREKFQTKDPMGREPLTRENKQEAQRAREVQARQEETDPAKRQALIEAKDKGKKISLEKNTIIQQQFSSDESGLELDPAKASVLSKSTKAPETQVQENKEDRFARILTEQIDIPNNSATINDVIKAANQNGISTEKLISPIIKNYQNAGPAERARIFRKMKQTNAYLPFKEATTMIREAEDAVKGINTGFTSPREAVSKLAQQHKKLFESNNFDSMDNLKQIIANTKGFKNNESKDNFRVAFLRQTRITSF